MKRQTFHKIGKWLFYLLLTLCISGEAFSQNTNANKAAEIRQQMSTIRQSTNWDNPAEAQKANGQIKVLMNQLIKATSGAANTKPNTNANSATNGDGSINGGNDDSDSDAAKMSELQMEMAKHKMDVYNQIWEAGMAGKVRRYCWLNSCARILCGSLRKTNRLWAPVPNIWKKKQYW